MAARNDCWYCICEVPRWLSKQMPHLQQRTRASDVACTAQTCWQDRHCAPQAFGRHELHARPKESHGLCKRHMSPLHACTRAGRQWRAGTCVMVCTTVVRLVICELMFCT